MTDADRVFFAVTGILLGIGGLFGLVTLIANIRVFKSINKRLHASGLSLSWFSYTNSWRIDSRMREVAPTEFARAYRLKWVTLGFVGLLAVLWLLLCLYTDAAKQKVIKAPQLKPSGQEQPTRLRSSR